MPLDPVKPDVPPKPHEESTDLSTAITQLNDAVRGHRRSFVSFLVDVFIILFYLSAAIVLWTCFTFFFGARSSAVLTIVIGCLAAMIAIASATVIDYRRIALKGLDRAVWEMLFVSFTGRYGFFMLAGSICGPLAGGAVPHWLILCVLLIVSFLFWYKIVQPRLERLVARRYQVRHRLGQARPIV